MTLTFVGTVEKQPSEIFSFTVDFGLRLTTITSISVTASDVSGADQTAVLINASSYSGTVATVEVKAGTDGLRYNIRILAYPVVGKPLEEDVLLVVKNVGASGGF